MGWGGVKNPSEYLCNLATISRMVYQLAVGLLKSPSLALTKLISVYIYSDMPMRHVTCMQAICVANERNRHQ